MGQTSRISRNNTAVRTVNGLTEVILHSTTVVRMLYLGEDEYQVCLDSGGWQTHTTKARMNQTANQFGLSFGVSQTKGVWYVYTGPLKIRLDFQDGMTFTVKRRQYRWWEDLEAEPYVDLEAIP